MSRVGAVPDEWKCVEVRDVLVRKSGEAVFKLQTSDYNENGELPIVDQGAKFICGYTDNLNAAYPYDLPVVVFGDHTRTLKYVDFPFAVGADGTQCLHPTDELDHRFFFYSLENIDLRSEGYARHFKILKERSIAIPPIDEQRSIAEVLQSVDKALAAADLALQQTKIVRQSILNNLLFPDTTQLSSARLRCRLSEVIDIAHGFAFKSDYFTANQSDPILLTPGNFSVEKTLYFGERTKHYSGPIPKGYVLENGSLVVVMTDLTQGMAILGNAVEITGNNVILHNQRIGRVSMLKPDLVLKEYAKLLLNSDFVQSRVKATASGSTVRHTAPSRILECEVELPTLDEQTRIIAIAKSLDNIVSAEERRRSDVEKAGPLSYLRSLKSVIADDLLSGRVRVPT